MIATASTTTLLREVTPLYVDNPTLRELFLYVSYQGQKKRVTFISASLINPTYTGFHANEMLWPSTLLTS